MAEEPTALEKRMVDGHPMLPWYWRTLELVLKDGLTSNEVVKQLNDEGFTGVGGKEIDYYMVRSIRRKAWFVEESKQNVLEAAQTTSAIIAEGAADAGRAFNAVMKGEEKYAKFGNAVMQGNKIIYEAGSEPLIDRKPRVQITHNKQINILSVDSKRFENLTQEQVNEYARTGELPPEEDSDG